MHGHRILLTNDDGYGAPGMEALAGALSGVARVDIVAPAVEQSAKSHAITLGTPLRLEKKGEGRFTLDGTPSDCVYMGIHKVLEDVLPDLVVSGINRGPNVGSDVVYSGTVAAAVEGALIGVPAIAFSLAKGNDFTGAARLAARIVGVALRRRPIAQGTVWNVNFPERVTGEMAVTRLGRRSYGGQVVERLDPRGKPYLWVGGSEAVYDRAPGTDCEAVFGRLVTSVTPLTMDMTASVPLSPIQEALDGIATSAEQADSSIGVASGTGDRAQ